MHTLTCMKVEVFVKILLKFMYNKTWVQRRRMQLFIMQIIHRLSLYLDLEVTHVCKTFSFLFLITAK